MNRDWKSIKVIPALPFVILLLISSYIMIHGYYAGNPSFSQLQMVELDQIEKMKVIKNKINDHPHIFGK
jgi:hypothetical protein